MANSTTAAINDKGELLQKSLRLVLLAVAPKKPSTLPRSSPPPLELENDQQRASDRETKHGFASD
jgi:hypothetical protein